MPPTIAIASLMQESNSFSPLPTTVETFASYYIHRGDEILTGYRRRPNRGAGLSRRPGGVRRDTSRRSSPPMPRRAAPSPAQPSTTLVGEMEERLRAVAPVDGLLLALHGALVVEDQPDGDGEIIERMRRILPPSVPIGVSLDLHGHLTPLMLQPNVFHIGYREYPHIDMYETGVRTARTPPRRGDGSPKYARDGARQAAADRQPGLHPHH